MGDDVKSFVVEQIADGDSVSKIELMDLHLIAHRRQIAALYPRIIKVVEVIENCDFVTGSEQFFDQMRTNKPRAARHQSSHRASVKMNVRRSKARTRTGRVFVFFLVFVIALSAGIYFRFLRETWRAGRIEAAFRVPSPFDLASLPTARRFDFPIGSEGGAFAYNAQPFTENAHLGDDLNGIGGENSDLGDPVFSVGDGRVIWAAEGGPGWGKIVIILHAYEENGARKHVQSYYAHLETIMTEASRDVRRGEQIGTIGTAGGRYLAHLHFEMREFVTPLIGPGYREDTRGWINPSEFIRQHRGAAEEDVGRPAFR